jgi:arsenate reductase (thioredoxin)
MKKVLFVCLGNACRSPMAEAIARSDAADVIDASSAGLVPLGFIPDATRAALTSKGYTPEQLQSKPVTRAALESAEIVINMSGAPKEHAFHSSSCEKVEDWNVQDPYGEDPHVYQAICEDIVRRVGHLAQRLRSEQQNGQASA